MSDIKLVLTDFDGTVVQLGKHEVSDRVRQAVIACQNRGVEVAAITGRPFEMARPVLEILGFEDLCICDNGASIRRVKTGELVWSKWIDSYTLKLITRVLLPHSKILDYGENHEEHEIADNEDELIEMIEHAAPYVYGLIREDRVSEISKKLGEIPNITFYTAISSKGIEGYLGIQINHASGDKFHGAEALREITGIAKEHTLAIGDGTNDLPLFTNAGTKVAMGNAVDELKAAADYVVATVDDDGFVEAMERFVLQR